MSTTWIAYATTSASTVGADPGITIVRKTVEDGMVTDETEVASDVAGTQLDSAEEWHGLDEAAADAMLARMGYERGKNWEQSGGQLAVEVEPTAPGDETLWQRMERKGAGAGYNWQNG